MNDIVIEKNTDKSTAAFASPRTDPNDPLVINDCDISISNTSTSAAGLLKTITHELGHCVGLGHPHTNYGALMGYSRDGNDWRLGADDKAGIIFLYPDPNYANAHPRELIGCGHISGNRSTSPSLLFFLLILPLILALAKSAKRVRPQ